MSNTLTKIIASTLNSTVQKTLKNSKLPATSASIITSTVSSLTNNIAKNTNTTVNSKANKSVNDISNNLIGRFNPVNLVSSNLSASSLQNILVNNVGANLNKDVRGIINKNVNEILRLNLPAGTFNPIFGLLNNTINNSLNSQVSRLVNVALNNYSTGIFSNDITVPPVVSNTDQLFASGDAEEGIELYTEQYNSALVGESLNESNNFDVKNEDNTKKLEVTKKGFVDPTATYPTEEYKGRPDTNKLATGDVQGTAVQLKNKQLMVGAKLPGGKSWSQPESPYKAQYPYNKVTQTEQGHIIEIDDTPGAERLHIYHRTGTFIEIDSNGSFVKRTKGSDYEIIDRNGYISIAGKADISINGACNIYVGNDANIEVDGDTNITCHNDITAQAGGKLNLSAVESLSIRSTDIFIEADKELNLLSSTFTKITSDVIHERSNSAKYITTKDLFEKVQSNKFTEVSKNFHNKVGGNFNLDTGGIVNIGNGSSTGSQESLKAKNSLAGLLSGRKDITIVDLTDPLFLTKKDEFVLSAEEPSASPQEIANTKNRAVSRGIVSNEKFEEIPVPLKSESPKTENSAFIPSSENIKQLTEVPDNFNLSPNFTLGMLSTKSAVTKNKLVAQAGKTYGEILFNLSAVALNICEPVLKLYPNMYITSAFRLQSSSSSTSQHPLGQAVDIQFRGISKKDYYEIARVLATKLNYDQILLEYASITNNPWIHISLNPDKRNRTQIMTFNNHAKYSDGLTQLA
jgi:uncharacterized protein YcbK (DUF882 family)